MISQEEHDLAVAYASYIDPESSDFHPDFVKEIMAICEARGNDIEEWFSYDELLKLVKFYMNRH